MARLRSKNLIAAISPNSKSDAPKQGEEGFASPPAATIFKKNVKKNSKLRPFNEIINDVGHIQYFPA